MIAPKPIRFRDNSEANTVFFAAKIDNEFLFYFPPNSNPNEDAEYIVVFIGRTFD